MRKQEKDYAPIESDMTKEEFIEKIKKQCYYIAPIDAFRLINFYTYEFGVTNSRNMDIETELSFMFIRLCGKKISKKHYYTKRICSKCDNKLSPSKPLNKVCEECLLKRKHRTN